MVPFHGSGNYQENSPRSAVTAVENKPSERCVTFNIRGGRSRKMQQAVDIGESDKTMSICLADLAASGPPCCPRNLSSRTTRSRSVGAALEANRETISCLGRRHERA
ncbi:uncharacterized protein LOC129758211 isoform X3 [Uranotaenia lowii]|uniref:uncharacterized protein LOC129758211 isoform X3 n=1 Tax=Uranotaenia lowii TaxID=190385 RepID=UPI002478F86C|nr:uncharacterized protein LOC129758211 isoform X3 [Uranotaenia lowii]